MKKFTLLVIAGIGGFRIAMESLGGKCVFSSGGIDMLKKPMKQIMEKFHMVILPKKIKKESPKVLMSYVLVFHIKHFLLLVKEVDLKIQSTLFLKLQYN